MCRVIVSNPIFFEITVAVAVAVISAEDEEEEECVEEEEDIRNELPEEGKCRCRKLVLSSARTNPTIIIINSKTCEKHKTMWKREIFF
jgi:hypothetical protein